MYIKGLHLFSYYYQNSKLAHILAQYARNLDSYVTWVEKNLVLIGSVLAHDVLNLSSYE